MFHSTYLLAALLIGAEPNPAQPVTVPFELLRSGHMAVAVKVNGKGPYRLIFDTGAPLTLLNNKIAREAGLLKKVRQPTLPLFGSAGEVSVKKLEVGEQAAHDVAAVVMDHPTVEAISRAFGPIDGIVGFPFFARFKTTLDYQKRTITFAPNGFKPPDVLRSMVLAIMADDPEQVRVLSPAAQWGFVVRKEVGDEGPGVTVKEVLMGGAAAAGGLKAGDRLLTVGGRWTDSVSDLYTAVEKIKPGTEATIRVRRGGKELDLRVKPAVGL